MNRALAFGLIAFVERADALVPPPRMHHFTFHGVLTSDSLRRNAIVSTAVGLRRSSYRGEGSNARPCHRYS
jgi:hypothetical protein